MPTSHLIASFFAGLFLANTVPHYVQGVCGEPFPTPFAKPPGKGLSSPLVNVLWGLFNMVVGTILFRVADLWSAGVPQLGVFFVGVAGISIMAGVNFAKKDRH